MLRQDVNNLFDHWPAIKETLKGKDVFLFLDYDGTLTPIVERPEFAILSPETKKNLKRLANNDHFHVFIISGRAMADVKGLVGVDNIVYVGNHGFEIEGADIDFGDFSFVQVREIFEYLKKKIAQEWISLKGVFVEDKGMSLSVHYRTLNLQDESIFRVFFEKLSEEFVLRKAIRIVAGKKVFEVRPSAEWDKGRAVWWLLKTHADAMSHQAVSVIYVGDDHTDEDAFKVLHKTAVTIHVGNHQLTAAEYFLADPQEVAKFLEILGDLK